MLVNGYFINMVTGLTYVMKHVTFVITIGPFY